MRGIIVGLGVVLISSAQTIPTILRGSCDVECVVAVDGRILGIMQPGQQWSVRTTIGKHKVEAATKGKALWSREIDVGNLTTPLSISLNGSSRVETLPKNTTPIRADVFEGLQPVTRRWFLDSHILESELSALQYYAGETVLLFRSVRSADEKPLAGQTITILGTTYEILVIERGTPGIAAPQHSFLGLIDEVHIAFEPECYLYFGSHGRQDATYSLESEHGVGCKKKDGSNVSYSLLTQRTRPVDHDAIREILKQLNRPLEFSDHLTLWVRPPGIKASGTARVAPGMTLAEPGDH